MQRSGFFPGPANLSDLRLRSWTPYPMSRKASGAVQVTAGETPPGARLSHPARCPPQPQSRPELDATAMESALSNLCRSGQDNSVSGESGAATRVAMPLQVASGPASAVWHLI
jgi:hypothetical protein